MTDDEIELRFKRLLMDLTDSHQSMISIAISQADALVAIFTALSKPEMEREDVEQVQAKLGLMLDRISTSSNMNMERVKKAMDDDDG